MFGNLNQTAGGDPDGDGVTNLQELEYGTNPLSAQSGSSGLSDFQAVSGVTPIPVNVVPASQTGVLEHDVWLNISGSNVTDLTSNSAFAGPPDVVDYVTSAASPLNYGQNFQFRI